MSRSYDLTGMSGGTLSDQSAVNTLAEAPNGDLHLLVTFESLPDAQPRDGENGDVHDATVIVPGADRELADDRESTADRDVQGEPDSSDGLDAPTDFVGSVDWEPSVDSVTPSGASNPEYIDPEFDEAADVESLVSYLCMDFVEHELFAERFLPESNDVVYTSRGVGTYQLLCVYSADRGLLLVVDEDEAIRPLVGHARSLLTEP
jgi:hypothetical protein